MKNSLYFKIIDNIKTIFYALLIASVIRSLLFQPFYIPSSSMEPTLLIGDRIFVSKYTYGFSKHSFPFSPPILKGRIFNSKPKRGDLVVFKTPTDNRTDFIKRIIGLPGDTIQFKNGLLYLNEKKLKREKINKKLDIRCGTSNKEVNSYQEFLPNTASYTTVYHKEGSFKNSDIYGVTKNHYFLLGDNRDCSSDSRYLASVGFVPEVNLVGKARFVFFSNDTYQSSVLKFWNWSESFRFNRTFSKLK